MRGRQGGKQATDINGLFSDRVSSENVAVDDARSRGGGYVVDAGWEEGIAVVYAVVSAEEADEALWRASGWKRRRDLAESHGEGGHFVAIGKG